MRYQTYFKNILQRIGDHLVFLREQKGYYSAKDFAKAFELPPVHYWRIENAKTNVTMKSLATILEIHNMTVVDFFCEILQEKPVVE